MLLFFLYYSVVKSFFKDFFVFSFLYFSFLKAKTFRFADYKNRHSHTPTQQHTLR